MITRISPDDAVDLLTYLPEERQQTILSTLDREIRFELEKLLIFDRDTAGGLMTTEYAAVQEEYTVGETIQFLRKDYADRDLYTVYVLDESRHLLGTVPINTLVISGEDVPVRSIMVSDPITITPDMPSERVAALVSNYDLLAIPVVDADRKILGVVTFDDVLDVLEEKATEDMYHLANLDKEERVFTPVSRSVRLRAGWLLINLCTAILAALTVSLFRDTIQSYVALAVLMPIVAGMGGNAGSQSLTVVVRGLALGELTFSGGWKAVLKEVNVGFYNGLIHGTIMGLICYFWFKNPILSIIMVLAMIATLTISGLFGALVPIILRWFRKDPALGSSIFVTTATDVGGFFTFLGLASLAFRFFPPA